MRISLNKKGIFAIAMAMAVQVSMLSFANTEKNTKENTMMNQATVTSQILEKAKANDNWKLAFATGKHAQVVFMNVSPSTNPANEIGMETHPFDQVILIVSGHGQAILNGKTSPVNSGDMIFIPQGTAHNVVNSDKQNPLKLISFYSNTDIPAGSVYKKKS